MIDVMGNTEKLDLYKQHKAEYAARQKPALIEAQRAQYLAVCGRGAPGSDEFQVRIGALYAAAFTIKMTRKFAGRGDYVICKLEGQYWDPDGAPDLPVSALADLHWRLMIRTPDFVDQEDLDDAVRKIREKGKDVPIEAVELFELAEGTCVQMLHVGPYEQESVTLERMREWLTGEGWTPHGRHHEIYLSDPRRVAPEKLRTILRLPVRKADA